MFPFESLEVYKKAFTFHKSVFSLLNSDINSPQYLKNQIGRASLSIILNIAEGSAKFGVKDKRNYFVIARGSVYECRALLQVLQSEELISQEYFDSNSEVLVELSKMLYKMIKNLEVSK